jgi:hypothetical protein
MDAAAGGPKSTPPPPLLPQDRSLRTASDGTRYAAGAFTHTSVVGPLVVPSVYDSRAR